ncbi:DsbA family protein [Paracoccus aminophilus]|uniref:DsbA family protein n=1 Tax=Paracoccus aminophilus TaxID=34003 RepID=UPI0011DDD63C|nr:DsbA family protein [Paracoccus aminophilus]
MLTRRHALLSGLATGAAFALPALAAEENPMPPELRKALERDPNAPVLGNPNGDITLTEFFDYNCPYCRVMVKDVHQLITDDKNLRVVFREWPVFGEGSIFTTRVSLASLKQGKYWQFHSAMMAIKGKADERSAMRTAEKVGLDLTRLKKDMDSDQVYAHMDRSTELADHMGLVGTPTFIAGNEGLFGKQSLTELKEMIARGRKALAKPARR